MAPKSHAERSTKRRLLPDRSESQPLPNARKSAVVTATTGRDHSLRSAGVAFGIRDRSSRQSRGIPPPSPDSTMLRARIVRAHGNRRTPAGTTIARRRNIRPRRSRRRRPSMRAALIVALCVCLAACNRAPDDAKPAQPAPAADATKSAGEAAVAAAVQPLFEGLGSLHFPITTTSEDAQRYFDQGLMLSFAFNHAAADLAFTEAQKRDPACALCWWGGALVLGPNINASMEATVVD